MDGITQQQQQQAFQQQQQQQQQLPQLIRSGQNQDPNLIRAITSQLGWSDDQAKQLLVALPSMTEALQNGNHIGLNTSQIAQLRKVATIVQDFAATNANGAAGMLRPNLWLPLASAQPKEYWNDATKGQSSFDTSNFNIPGPMPWPSPSGVQRPTLTGGLVAGLHEGTPSHVERPKEDPTLFVPDVRPNSLRKNPGAQEHVRKRIQDLVGALDSTVKVEPEAEELLLEIADEFIESVANFACRLAKHRGSETLDVKDLQLHLEMHHNLRIPGFTVDPPTQTGSSAPTAAAGGSGSKKNAAAAAAAAQANSAPKRSARLAAVQQAKRDSRLL